MDIDKASLTERALRPNAWIAGSELAILAGPPTVADCSEPAYALHPGRTQERFGTDMAGLFATLDKPPVSVRPYLLHDTLLLGCGHIVVSRGAFLLESKYLNPDLDKRIALSLRDPVLDLDPETVWIVGGNASMKNYWHWLAQSLPAIAHCTAWLRELGARKIGLITPELQPYQRESLRLAGLAPAEVVELTVFRSARAAHCAYSPFLSGAAAFTPSAYRRAVREAMLANAGIGTGSGPRRLFLSRRDSRKRPLHNEAEVIACLAEFGFVTVCPGTMPVAEQVRTFARADLVVAPHGAGSANYLFMRPGSRVLELQQQALVNAGPLSLCKTAGTQAWVEIFADSVPGEADAGWRADIPVVREAVATIIARGGPLSRLLGLIRRPRRSERRALPRP